MLHLLNEWIVTKWVASRSITPCKGLMLSLPNFPSLHLAEKVVGCPTSQDPRSKGNPCDQTSLPCTWLKSVNICLFPLQTLNHKEIYQNMGNSADLIQLRFSWPTTPNFHLTQLQICRSLQMPESSSQSLNVEFINPHIIYSHSISNIISDKRTTFVIFLTAILLSCRLGIWAWFMRRLGKQSCYE